MTEGWYTVRVDPDKVGVRLDRLLAEAIEPISRTRLQGLIEAGAVTDAHQAAVRDPAYRVRAGEAFRVRLPAPPAVRPQPQAIALIVVHEDDDLIVVDKPAGLVVHPGAGNPDGTLVNALLAHCPGGLAPASGIARPGIVHRLDKDTSGLLVAAKSDRAYLHLIRLFSRHDIDRRYHAVVWGNPIPPHGRIDRRIGRHPKDRMRMAVVGTGGKTAVTDYATQQVFGSRAALVECRPLTGRTHQIRVHMASLGHPLIGDPLYQTRAGAHAAAALVTEGQPEGFKRQALHAYLIGFRHPDGDQLLRFESSLPRDIKALINVLETCENAILDQNGTI